jgi:hypothetical protein
MTKKTRKQRKVKQLRLFKLRRDLLQTSINLQTPQAADTHLAEGQWLTEQLNMAKYMFRVETIIIITNLRIPLSFHGQLYVNTIKPGPAVRFNIGGT